MDGKPSTPHARILREEAERFVRTGWGNEEAAIQALVELLEDVYLQGKQAFLVERGV